MPESRSMTQVQPPGMISYFANDSAPGGWLLCNGAQVSRTTYSDLFAAIGTTFGAGNGSSTFNVPDLRGEFLRGWDGGRGVDAGYYGNAARGFATVQKGSAFAYNLPWNEGAGGTMGSGNDNPISNSYQYVGADTAAQSDYPTTGAVHGNGGPFNTGNWITDGGWGGGAVRPRNFSLLICIKF